MSGITVVFSQLLYREENWEKAYVILKYQYSKKSNLVKPNCDFALHKKNVNLRKVDVLSTKAGYRMQFKITIIYVSLFYKYVSTKI